MFRWELIGSQLDGEARTSLGRTAAPETHEVEHGEEVPATRSARRQQSSGGQLFEVDFRPQKRCVSLTSRGVEEIHCRAITIFSFG